MSDNVRFNRETNHYDFYFPMELLDDADREFARFCGFEIGMAKLGFRNFLAVFVPCKDKVIDASGREVFIETSEEAQRKRYYEYIKDELKEQDAAKQDGRCQIPDGKGGVMRCPCRIDNPDYVPGGDQSKTLPVRCEGCKYEPFRHSHTYMPFSAMGHEGEDGEMEPYEAASPKGYMDGFSYDELARLFVAYVREENPKLADLAELLALEYTRSEAARMLDIPLNTAWSRKEKLKELCQEFLDNLVRLA